jgi:hypothetical protein
MTMPLHLTSLAEGWFQVSQGAAAPERWSKDDLLAFLLAHGYSADDADWIMEHACESVEMDVHIFDAGPS